MELRKPATGSSFTGMGEVSLTPEMPVVGHDVEYERLERRLRKLEMLLEVYDIPLPPWKEGR